MVYIFVVHSLYDQLIIDSPPRLRSMNIHESLYPGPSKYMFYTCEVKGIGILPGTCLYDVLMSHRIDYIPTHQKKIIVQL